MPVDLQRDYYTSAQVAQKLGLTPQHVARLCRQGKWKALKFGREYAIPRQLVEPRPWREHNPDELARHFRDKLRLYIDRQELKLRILGILANGDEASKVYAQFLVDACADVGIQLDLQVLAPADVKRTVLKANADENIQGIFVFYPIYKDARDAELKALLAPEKDIEGLSPFWMRRLYGNVRWLDAAKTKKAILPCTPLAVLKTLEYAGLPPDVPRPPFKGRKVAVFNRSELTGKPLAHMLMNDGAEVFSFDVDGGRRLKRGQKSRAITRAEALAQADMIVTGVPSRAFEKIRGEEIRAGAICLNFSFVQNFEDSAKMKAGVYVPRVGPMTIAMCLRNMVRLYENYRERYEGKN
jgi:methylenetetrahydrofolate dehydrogenase (NADP+)/methenyltetrahydrofolate cyclohydrolase